MISLRTRKRGNPFYHVSRKLRDWSSSISLEFDRHTLERSCCDSLGPKPLDYAKSLKVSTTKVPCQVLPHHPRNFQVSEHHSESPVHARYAACNSPLHLPTPSNIFQHPHQICKSFWRCSVFSPASSSWFGFSFGSLTCSNAWRCDRCVSVSSVILSHLCHLNILWIVFWVEQHCIRTH